MLHCRKTVSDSLFDPYFTQHLLRRCLPSKSGHGHGDLSWKSRAGKHGDEDEGGEEKLRLFKGRGQHLLTNHRVLDSIVRNSNIKPDDTVLEIGSGTGNLTLKLLESAKRVVAVEIDDRMVEVLRNLAAERGFLDRLKIINGDALKANFPEFNLVVANIPYGISSPLLAKLVYGVNANPFRSATLLLQKEFARRLLAKPGDSGYNRLAVNMTMMADVEFVMDVSKRDFIPCPKVDSSVVKIYPKCEIPDVDLNDWWAFTRTCFSKKNKTLGSTFRQKRKLLELLKLAKGSSCDSEGSFDLPSGIGIDMRSFRGKIVSILECGGFLDKRPSKLSNEDLLQLLSLFNESGIYFHNQATPKVSFADCDDML